MKSDGNFGAQLVLTSDEAGFRKTWNTATSPPVLRSADALRRGERISGMILFHGCAAKSSGNCDGLVRFNLVDPSGKSAPAGEGPLWTSSPQAGRILLSNTSVTVGFDASDQLGTYKLAAEVTDKASGKRLELIAPFRLGN
jgi:hypothetical protein